jgi:uncharacterized protein involved in tolerance to divalent cations
MTKRISVGERLAEDMVVEWGESSLGNDNGVDALFSAFSASDVKIGGHAYVVGLITAASWGEAYEIANTLVGQRKAACVNILPRVNSIFWWNGKVEQAEESFLLVKTRIDLFRDVVNLVSRIHSYDVPEIIALPVVGGNSDYLKWVSKETGEKTGIRITVGDIEVEGWLNVTDTAAKVLQALPLTSRVSLWGDELYFPVPVDKKLENGKETVSLGDIAYWPPGKAICIFLGRTPLSKGEEIRTLTPVEVIGRIELSQDLAGRLRQGEKITMTR